MVDSGTPISGYRFIEKIYESSRTLVIRAKRESDAVPVVLKLMRNEYPSLNELVQFRNQYAIAKNINLPGVVKVYSLETYQNRYALVLEDFGGISLKDYTQQQCQSFTNGAAPLCTAPLLPVADFLTIALQIAAILDRLHRLHIIHKDIKPANILINPTTKQVKLVDFSIASLLPREIPEMQGVSVLEGTLYYISPEQTGRMNRGIDYRTDYYSLGVTFYELLTGRLPFVADDRMEVVHCHLAKYPPAAHAINPDIPPIFSAIINKLMAKNAENRYQSALGLKADLERCLQQWREAEAIDEFELGTCDQIDQFVIPEKLYGRGQEVNTLLAAFERVSQAAAELMLITGFSGIGKTAVVNEIHKPIVRQRGYFIKGKFDQLQRNVPFFAFVQAFRDLVGQLLTESDARLHQWKSEILAAVGNNGQVMVDVIPELEGIIGLQPPVPELAGSAAHHRFDRVFQQFIQVFATATHPLVIFLDDLQWADSASLGLIQRVMGEAHLRHVLLIGAYRDNEVSPAHPLTVTIEQVRQSGTAVHTLRLPPLDSTHINHLIADTLNCSIARSQPLTALVYRKTQGNPFFTAQFLKALYDERHIVFNADEGCWQYDIAQVNALSLTDDVVEFIGLQLQRLPNATQTVLKLAACVGNQFDLKTLAIVRQESESSTAAALWTALRDGLILPVNEVYKLFHHRSRDDAPPFAIDRSPRYRFLHDRVQQAAYSLIPPDQKQITHLKIGQLLLKNTPTHEREERIFEIVNQLNVGAGLLTRPGDRTQLAQLNLMAGRKAKLSTAYSTANNYFAIAMQGLPDDAWQDHYALTLALYTEATEVSYLKGDFDSMERLGAIVLEQAESLLDTIRIYETQLQAYSGLNRFDDGIAVRTGII
ncbi:MAG: serine/threonine-protein kinase PknK [Leptolyngbyaceae cyanobacterium SL_7_1]|nr:serine/threonine-protein kinase PknK [Leptolyngbyaceae cyanobacterium SL_7_1]